MNKEILKPQYYQNPSGYDVLSIIEEFNLGFHEGNVLKYIVRAGKKEGEDKLKDLNKALEYLNRKIEYESR